MFTIISSAYLIHVMLKLRPSKFNQLNLLYGELIANMRGHAQDSVEQWIKLLKIKYPTELIRVTYDSIIEAEDLSDYYQNKIKFQLGITLGSIGVSAALDYFLISNQHIAFNMCDAIYNHLSTTSNNVVSYFTNNDLTNMSDIMTNFNNYISTLTNPTKKGYCLTIGTIGNIATIGTIAGYIGGFTIISPVLFSQLNKVKHHFPQRLQFDFSSWTIKTITGIVAATQLDFTGLYKDAKTMSKALEHSVEEHLDVLDVCGENPKGVMNYLFESNG